MATEINKNNFLGTMFPNVYVKQITLDKDYKVEAKTIDGYLKHHGAGPSSKNIITEEKLKITIKSEIYEQINEEGQLTALGAQGYEYYINFTTVIIAPQEKNPGNIKLAEKLIKDFSGFQDKGMLPLGTLKNNMPSVSKNLVKDIFYSLFSRYPHLYQDGLSMLGKYNPKASSKEKNLRTATVAKLIKTVPSFQGHGGKTYAVPFETEIVLEVPNHDNLAVVAFAEFDIESLIEDLSLIHI